MRFDTKPESIKTTNYMGETAYELRPKEKLLNVTATCMFGEPKYYEGANTVSNKIFETCDELNDPEFILKLAVYLRNELFLRTTPIALLVKVANMKSAKGTGLILKYAPYIIKRADELPESISAQIKLFGKPIPNSLKKAIAVSFNNFNEYQISKYNRDLTVKMKDVVKICHPKPYTGEQSLLFKKILTDALDTPYTWEVELSKGNRPKSEVWGELIRSRKVGYMATLRNVRNIAQAGVTDAEIDMVCEYLTNPKAILNSKQLPHRFLSAYEALEGIDTPMKFENERNAVQKLKKAIETAMIISAELNIPELNGRTVIISDNSGSARGDGSGVSKISSKSIRTMADLGNMLALELWFRSKNTITGAFGDKLTFVDPDRSQGILANFNKFNEAGKYVGESTETGVYLMLEYMIKQKLFADRIIVCSDLQIGEGIHHNCYNGIHNTVQELVKIYRDTVNPNFRYYSICFNGYGTDVVYGDKSALISGWSDNIFKFINTREQNSQAQIKYIESLTFVENDNENTEDN